MIELTLIVFTAFILAFILCNLPYEYYEDYNNEVFTKEHKDLFDGML